METKRYDAYNSTRGIILNAKLVVADREVEPLRFLELLIGGLGLDSESGIWLKPLVSAPQVPRVFPFDLLYLDQNQKVLQAAEIFPNGEFPPFSKEVVSALVLPLHAAATSKTSPGDQLLVRAQGEPAEQPQELSQSAAEVSQRVPEVVLQPAVLLQQAIEVPPQEPELALQPAEPPQPATVARLQIQEVVLQATEPSQQAIEAPPQEPEHGLQPEESSQQAIVVPLPIQEVVLQPTELPQHASEVSLQEPEPVLQATESSQQPAETPVSEPAAETGKSSIQPETDAESARLPVPFSPPVPAPAQTASTGTVDQDATKATVSTASVQGSTLQNLGSTIAQYRAWQVSTSTPPAATLKSQESQSQEPSAESVADSQAAESKPNARKKSGEKFLRSAQSTQSNSEPPAQGEGPLPPAAQDLQKSNPAGRASGPRRELLLDSARIPLTPSPTPASIATESAKSANQPSNIDPANVVDWSTPDLGVKPQESQLPLWKALPNPVTLTTAPAKPPIGSQPPGETAETSQRVIAPVPQADRANGATEPKPPLQKIARRQGAKPVVEQPPDPPSHLPRIPEAFSRLMTAIHRIGETPDSQSLAEQKGTQARRVPNLLNPEALHRDRRRAIRRIVPGLVAFYFTGGSPQPYTVADISATGFYLLTRDHWMPETMVLMTLQKPVNEGKHRRESITVLTRIVRRGDNGIGAEFVMPESLSSNNHDIKPSRATDRMALARFLFSDEFPDSFEILGCFITPPVDQQPGAEFAIRESGD